tara:strand:- start:937 stop:1569 length:633 start_codon:yes stop_codon:yes gene_type:complete
MKRNEDRIRPHWIQSPGWLHVTVPESVKKELIESMKTPDGDARSGLKGHLSEEYYLPITKEVSRFTSSLANRYCNVFGSQHLKLDTRLDLLSGKPIKFELSTLWVNYQKKYDFNPTHIHSGIFSFVIWVKIPYDINEELKVYSKTSQAETSHFYFQYLSPEGLLGSHNIELTSEWEWQMVFFSSKLNHGVQPFYTSDETRISISGNLFPK